MLKQCSVFRCERRQEHLTRGWCSKHYLRWLRHGEVEPKQKPITKLPISPSDARWIAAVIDCEGTISARRTRQKSDIGSTYTPLLVVVNTDRRLTDSLLELSTIGVVRFRKRQAPWKDIHMWHVWKRNDVMRICRTIVDHLILKRDQARLLLAEWPMAHEYENEKRKEITDALQALNARGR